MKLFKHGAVILSFAGFVGAGILPAFAHKGVQANAAYVGDSKGQIVVDTRGECVRTMHWTPAMAISECEGGKKVTAAEPAKTVAAKPEPMKVATVPKPAPKRLSLDAMTLFDLDSANLRPAGKDKLEAALAEIKSTKAIESITVVGHTDNTGDVSYNQTLSEQRARGVADYLIGSGVPADVITTSGKGELEPVANNATNEGRAKNRRVDIDIEARQ